MGETWERPQAKLRDEASRTVDSKISRELDMRASEFRATPGVPGDTTMGGVAGVINALRKYLALLCVAAMPVGFFYIIYAWITYTGVWRWFAEWQLEGGSYSVTTTFLTLTAATVFLPLGLGLLLSMGLPVPAASAPTTPVLRPQPPRRPQSSRYAADRPRLWLLLAIVSLAVAVGSGWLGYEKTIEPVIFEAVNLADQRPPKSRHVELTAIAQTPFIVEFTETINGHATLHTYLPLTAPNWRKGEPVAYFLRPNFNFYVGPKGNFSIDPKTRPFEITQKGVLFRDDLPGIVSAEYEKHGFVLASPPVVLDTDESADTFIYFAIAFAGGLGALCGLMLAGMLAFKGRRARQA